MDKNKDQQNPLGSEDQNKYMDDLVAKMKKASLPGLIGVLPLTEEEMGKRHVADKMNPRPSMDFHKPSTEQSAVVPKKKKKGHAPFNPDHKEEVYGIGPSSDKPWRTQK